MGMKRFLVIFALGLAGCGDDVDVGSFAVDLDENGQLECADLDHLLACIHHQETACDHADVHHDGVVDEGDAVDLHAGLEHHGIHCDAP